jgi:hypothetical protein
VLIFSVAGFSLRGMMAPAQLMERLSTLEQENAELRAQLEWFKRNLV